MNSILKFLVPVCCIALSSAVEMEIAGLPINVPLTPAEVESCPAYINSFKAQYTIPSADCGGAAFDTKQWNNFKLGFSDVQRDFGASFAECHLKVTGATDPQRAYCDYILNVFTACRCDTTTCIAGDLVGKIATDKKAACYGVPTTMCESTQTAMNTRCQAAVSAAAPESGKLYDKTKVVLKCAKEDCPKKNTIEVPVEIPDLPKFNVPLTPAEVESCPTYIDSFKTQYTTPSADCGGAAFVTKQWNNFKLGFSDAKVGSGSSAVARDFGTSYADCKTKDTGSAAQLAFCEYINKVATQCRCDTTTCISGDLVGKVTTDKKTECYGVPTTMCESTQTAMNSPCQTAVSAAVASPIDTPYVKTKVVLKCAKEDCPKKPQADTPKASGALGLAAMVALVTMITTMIIA